MKVYVVTEGEYSDYHIVEIFTNKEKAELLAEPFYERRVEEFELDPETPDYIKRGYKIFFINMFEDGGLPQNPDDFDVYEYSADRSSWDLNKARFVKHEYPYFHTGEKWRHGNDEDKPHNGEWVMEIDILAKDKKHAIKIANEKRVQLIGGNMWGTNNES
jgi:hypothetical protein